MRLLPLLLLATPALAQLPPGKDGYSFPPGGTRGTVVSATLGGTDWTPDVKFVVSDPRVRLEVLGTPGPVLVPDGPYWFGNKSFLNDPNLPREVPVKWHLPADLPPGLVKWSAVTASGAGAGGVFAVGAEYEDTEDETRKNPQPLSIPVVLNGRLGRIEEVDRYTFTASRSELVTLDLFARRLGNDINGVVEVFDGMKRVAEATDTEGTDPTLTFSAEKGKTYTVSVRDVDYRGFRSFTYRLALTTGPRIVTALPAAGRPGDRTSVEFVGYGLATGAAKLESVTADVEFPRTPAGGVFTYKLATPFGAATFPLQLSDTAERFVTDGPKLPGPCAINGRFTKRGERHTFTFKAYKGEVWELACQARRIGSPVDPMLTLSGPDGKQVLVADDAPDGSPDPKAVYTVPTGGEYTVSVADVSGKAPGVDSVFRLTLRKPQRGFTLKVSPILNAPIGGKTPLTVEVVREGGYAGPVVLSLAGLPEGVTLPKELTAPAGAPSFAVQLDCAKTAPASFATVTVSGTGTVDDRAVSVTAGEVLLATTMKPPFKVKSPEADGTRKVFRGSTHLADIVIERTDGFAGEILLDMAGAQQRHRQGIRGPVFPVAPDKARVLYPVTLPEWCETTRTSRIGLVAMAKIPDPKGTPRWVLAAMDGQVTMSVEGALLKLSVPPDEFAVTPGKTLDVPLRLARSPKLAGKVTVTLVVPPELAGLVSAAPLDWPDGESKAVLKVTTKADAKLTGVWTLTARANGTHTGFPVLSECAVEVEFTK